MNQEQQSVRDVYAYVTNTIIEQLEKGFVPWRRPWKGDDLPRNLLNKTHYRGINLLLLASLNYSQPSFLTFEQLKKIGGSVLKGEKGHLVVFWKVIEENVEGQEEKVKKTFLRYHKVFNVEQCKDIPTMPIEPQEAAELTPIEVCEGIVRDMQNAPTIFHKGSSAYYDPSTDAITMPIKKKFASIEAYYGVLWHELIHATGHSKRLGRKGITEPIVFGTRTYSQEELIAEIGASYLQAKTGILCDDTITNSAAYIASWLKQLKDDKKFVIQASVLAQKATDYVFNSTHEKKPD